MWGGFRAGVFLTLGWTREGEEQLFFAEPDTVLPPEQPASTQLPEKGIDLKEYLGNLERDLIEQALDEADSVVARAAEKLQIRRTTLVEKIRKYGLQR